MASTGRLRAYKLGHSAEQRCKWLLRLKGYTILESRYKTPVGEIDIIARRFRQLHFIEVKARPSAQECLEAISPQQRARIQNAAMLFIASSPSLATLDIHFDLMYLLPGSLPRHMVDAWRP